MMDVRAVLSAHHKQLILQFSLSYLDYHQSIIYYAQFKYFLLLCFVGNSIYLFINCVPKLVQGCSQVMRLRQINKVSILFYFNQRPLDSRTRTTTSMRFDFKFFRVFSKYRLLGKLHFTIFHKKISTVIFSEGGYALSLSQNDQTSNI